MKSNIQKLSIELQIEHFQSEIASIEMSLKDMEYDTFVLLTISSTHEVELEETESLQEQLEIYNAWYQQILYILNEYLQEDDVENKLLITGIDY